MATIISDGEQFVGGAEDDTVLIWANDVVADGRGGDDWLSTRLYDEIAAGISLSTRQIGGNGNDFLKAAMGLEAAPEDVETTVSISGTFDGGNGDDGIWVDFNSAYADQFVTVDAGDGDDRVTVGQTFSDRRGDDNQTHRSESAVRAGNGDDVVSVLLREGGGLAGFGGGTGATSTVHGSDGADRITSDVASYSGYEAENFLYGGDGDDEIVASARTSADWGSGSAYNRARGGEGDDRIEMEAGSSSGNVTNSATGDAGNDVISVDGGGLYGAVYNDISGGEGDDVLTARSSAGSDFFEEPAWRAINTVEGGDGDDRITGTVSTEGPLWNDLDAVDLYSDLYGGAGDDIITARGGFDNILAGNQGDDTLRGSGSTDRLIGGQGADVLRGGGGEDEFVFKGTRGEASERDRVADFSQGEDRFDLSAIDANVFRGGNQAFTFDGGTGTGRAWVEEAPNGNGSLLYADNGRGTLVVALSDGRAMDASDYEAGDFLL